jgi:hypothetical protein
MPEAGAYWIALKDGNFVTAMWEEAAGRWIFDASDDVMTPDEFAALGHTVHVRREGDESVDDLLRRYRKPDESAD